MVRGLSAAAAVVAAAGHGHWCIAVAACGERRVAKHVPHPREQAWVKHVAGGPQQVHHAQHDFVGLKAGPGTARQVSRVCDRSCGRDGREQAFAWQAWQGTGPRGAQAFLEMVGTCGGTWASETNDELSVGGCHLVTAQPSPGGLP